MVEQLKWTERSFDFSFPVGLLPNVIERLRGTPARLGEMISKLPATMLILRDGEGWSVQEHVGHLLDLESLHEGRLDDFLAGKKTLRAADMQNLQTWEADHNNKSMRTLLNSFRAARMNFVSRLEELDEKTAVRRALHPRLNQQMRVVDMAYFTAEHDDHHMATITRLARKLRPLGSA